MAATPTGQPRPSQAAITAGALGPATASIAITKGARIKKIRRDRLLHDTSARLLVLERFMDGPIPFRGGAERAAYVVDTARMYFGELVDDEVDLTKIS